MYNNYSFEANKIFKGAEKIMLKLGHCYVGTEHLLLSMLENSQEVKNILDSYDLNYNIFLDELVQVVDKSESKKENCIYTPLLKRIIKNAEDIAKNNPLKGVHLLESMLEEGEGIAVRIMLNLGIDLDKMYDDLKKDSKEYKPKLEIYNIGKNLQETVNDDIVVGRENEINLIIETLIRKNKNNPLLIGEAGVGKSAIVEELARRINKGLVPNSLKDKKIISLEMSLLVAGTKYRGEFEEKLSKIIKELENNPDIILFIDEIHTMTNAGGAEGAINASDILKPYLARNKIKIIGATTNGEFNKFFAKDKALTRRFEIIKINEPTINQTEEILLKLIPSFERHYKVKINKDNIKEIVSLTNKYVLDRFNPDKSIDLLDSVCAYKEVENINNKALQTLSDEKKIIIDKKCEMVKKNDFKEALKYRKEEMNILSKIEKLENTPYKITNEDIKKILQRRCNILVLNNKWTDLDKYLKENIIGQEEALDSIIDILKIKDDDKPTSIMLTGSTGVGKTKTVKEIAKYLNLHLIRLDMSEYSESITVNRLIGASAGYVGYDDANIFDQIKMNPSSIILLDEVEKASYNVLNLFLQILDEGFVTSSKGEKIDFKNTYIFMTSNAKVDNKIGFFKSKGNYQNNFSKEFLSRITGIINFKDVDRSMIEKYLQNKGLNNYEVINEYDYENLGFRGLDKFLKKNKINS